MLIEYIKRQLRKWLYPDYEEEYRPGPSHILRALSPGLRAWAMGWREAGLIHLDEIIVPSQWTHPDIAEKVKVMADAEDYTGIKEWWFNYLKEQEANKPGIGDVNSK